MRNLFLTLLFSLILLPFLDAQEFISMRGRKIVKDSFYFNMEDIPSDTNRGIFKHIVYFTEGDISVQQEVSTTKVFTPQEAKNYIVKLTDQKLYDYYRGVLASWYRRFEDIAVHGSQVTMATDSMTVSEIIRNKYSSQIKGTYQVMKNDTAYTYVEIDEDSNWVEVDAQGNIVQGGQFGPASGYRDFGFFLYGFDGNYYIEARKEPGSSKVHYSPEFLYKIVKQ